MPVSIPIDTSFQQVPFNLRPRGAMSQGDALSYVLQRVDPRVTDGHRWPMEREWMKNLAFLNGNQHFVEAGMGFRAPMPQPHRVTYRANMIRSAVTRMVSTVIANSTTFRAPTKDWTKKSRDQAFVSERLFEHLRETTHWQDQLEEALLWAAACGSGFIEIGWDPDAGAPERFYFDDQGKDIVPASDDERLMLEELGAFRDIPPGDVIANVPSPFQVQWDWTARRDWYQARWGATKQLIDLEVLEDIYGYEKTKNIRPSEPHAQAVWYEEMLSYMGSGFMGTSMFMPGDKRHNRAVWIRYFERPSIQNKYKGRHVAIAGDVVLVNGDNPRAKTSYPLPWIKLDWQRRPGSFMGHPVVEDMRNPQFQYNNARAKQTEVLNVHSHPAIFVDPRSGLPTGMLAIEPGVTYPADLQKTAGKPVVLGPTPAIPKELGESVNLAMAEMQAISSQADPDMSKLPGQIRGAPALDMMIAEKNKALLPAARSALKATLLGGRMMLSEARHNYTSQRKIGYVGEDNAYRILAFDAADIIEEIRIVGEPEYFKTKAAERAQMLEYIQVGALQPQVDPEDKMTVLKVLGYGNAEEAIAERLTDEENQQREWDEMAGDPLKFVKDNAFGQPMLSYPTQPFDDDGTHLRVMRQRMKTAEFRNLGPIARQLLMQHYQEHEQKEAARQAQLMMMQQNQRGMPGPKGQASQPKKEGAATSG